MFLVTLIARVPSPSAVGATRSITPSWSNGLPTWVAQVAHDISLVTSGASEGKIASRRLGLEEELVAGADISRVGPLRVTAKTSVPSGVSTVVDTGAASLLAPLAAHLRAEDQAAAGAFNL